MNQLPMFAEPTPSATSQSVPVADNPVLARARPKGAKRVPIAEQRERFQRILERYGIQHVSVDEARRATFRNGKLKSFDYIAYGGDGGNWLVSIGALNWDTRAGMIRWQKVFGDGFYAVFVKFHPTKGLRVTSLGGALLCGESDLKAALDSAEIAESLRTLAAALNEREGAK